MLSVLCSIYDPLGFIAPCILESKLIVQEFWKRNLYWDDPLLCDLLSRFENWQIELYLIKDGFNKHKGDTVELSIFTKYSSKYPSFVSSFIQPGFQTWVGNNTTYWTQLKATDKLDL